jgi:exopolysaccharide production protein ExoQ
MNGSRGGKLTDWLVLGGCAFVLSQAILPRVIPPAVDTPTEGSPLYRIILSVCYLSAAASLVPYFRETLFVFRRNWPLSVLVSVALVSCLWAEAPGLVLQRSIAACGTTLVGIAFAVRLSVEDQLRLISWVLRITAILSLAAVLFFPSFGISNGIGEQGEWRGVFGYKNGLGSMMALAVLVEWLLPTDTLLSKVVNRLALVISAVLLVFSSSVTPLAALVATLLFIELYKVGTRLRIPLYAIVLATLLLLASSVTALLMAGDRVTGPLGRSSDLTGRTDIWTTTMQYIPERPVLGYGYWGFWNEASSESSAVERALGTPIMYSHNGYIEVLLDLGAVGLLLTLIFLWTGIGRTYYFSERNRSKVGLWPLAFLCYFLLRNIGECSILMQGLEWALCVAIVVGTDAVLLAPDVEQGEEFLFVTREQVT